MSRRCVSSPFRRSAQRTGSRLRPTGQAPGGNRAIRAGGASQARFHRRPLQPGEWSAPNGPDTEAIAQYEQALRLRPDFVEALNNLGLALARTGRLPEAAAHWEEALRITPILSTRTTN